MPPKKYTQAVYKSMRLNPATSAEDQRTLEIIKDLESQGYTFKQIAQDAILRTMGYTPEMFSTVQTTPSMSGIENMLTRFADELLTKIDTGGYKAVTRSQEGDGGDVSPFTRKFAQSFMERQQRTVEED